MNNEIARCHGHKPWTMCSPSTGTVEDSSSALFPTGRFWVHQSGVRPVGGLQMADDYLHQPVLVDEVVALFGVVPAGLIVDCTLGGGGHAAALLAHRADIELLGLDRDPAALAAASKRLAPFGARASVVDAPFGSLQGVLGARPARPAVTGVLFDLGVSSPQLDDPRRGFSYRASGPLDMRMDPRSGRSALELVNEAQESELAALFAANGEGRLARRIARAIVVARPLTSTTELADVVAAAVPAPGRRRGHPARRVFQALRITVNDELAELEAGLDAALAAVVVGGRCVVIAYHSGEDRLVKAAFADAVSGGCTCPPQLPCVCGAAKDFRLVFRGSHQASARERAANHRSESARLRAVERVADSGRDGAAA
jgi:16S rRNA (cytosine1402-N4)-methyltransferase